IGDFVMEGRLGSGGMGIVYGARRRSLMRPQGHGARTSVGIDRARPGHSAPDQRGPVMATGRLTARRRPYLAPNATTRTVAIKTVCEGSGTAVSAPKRP